MFYESLFCILRSAIPPKLDRLSYILDTRFMPELCPTCDTGFQLRQFVTRRDFTREAVCTSRQLKFTTRLRRHETYGMSVQCFDVYDIRFAVKYFLAARRQVLFYLEKNI